MKKYLMAIMIATAAMTSFATSSNNSSGLPKIQVNQETVNKSMNFIKERLKITPEQNSAWEDYVKGNKIEKADAPLLTESKTIPEMMSTLSIMQEHSYKKFQIQKESTLKLYNVLSSEQKKMFDTMILGGVNAYQSMVSQQQTNATYNK